jgi:RimJ/RimL family protein N-acetyltransferase
MATGTARLDLAMPLLEFKNTLYRNNNPSCNKDAIYRQYLQEGRFFPLIASVLIGNQRGSIYVNSYAAPTTFFVEHKFGFSQIFGETNSFFLDALYQHLTERKFTAPKIRLYAPRHQEFLLECAELSERCQFRLKHAASRSRWDNGAGGNVKTVDIKAQNIREIDQALGLDLSFRFWDSEENFLEHGMGQAVKYNEKFVSVCYAAAVAERIAEIDVATLPEFRKRGFAACACSAFIAKCMERGITPNWDCFTNNKGSLRLAESLGFEKHGEPYPFFTLAKQ